MGRVSPGTFLLELDKLYAKQKGKGSVYVEMKRSVHCSTLFCASSEWLFLSEGKSIAEKQQLNVMQRTFVADYGIRSILSSRCTPLSSLLMVHLRSS
jgi:Signal recognition particle 14kD protein